MRLKLLVVLSFVFSLAGCMNSNEAVTSPKNFTFSYEMDSIEYEHNDEIQKWLNELDQTPTRTYEINDDVNGRHYIYGHSKIYSEVNVEQKEEAIILTFKNEKKDSSVQDALVKIKYNPDIIDSIALKTE